jgi:hypothetical protein
MTDITMCQNFDCPMQDNCWRLLAPPDKVNQSYQTFEFDYDGFENGSNVNGCDFYIAMDELDSTTKE